MNADDPDFLEKAAVYSPSKFEKIISRVAVRLKLDRTLNQSELALLCQASFCAFLCNVAFNGLGVCRGKIKPEREPKRLEFEQNFMSARARLFVSCGWQRLSPAVRKRLESTLLRVEILEENLAK